jgi:hypothetical protein
MEAPEKDMTTHEQSSASAEVPSSDPAEASRPRDDAPTVELPTVQMEALLEVLRGDPEPEPEQASVPESGVPDELPTPDGDAPSRPSTAGTRDARERVLYATPPFSPARPGSGAFGAVQDPALRSSRWLAFCAGGALTALPLLLGAVQFLVGGGGEQTSVDAAVELERDVGAAQGAGRAGSSEGAATTQALVETYAQSLFEPLDAATCDARADVLSVRR